MKYSQVTKSRFGANSKTRKEELVTQRAFKCLQPNANMLMLTVCVSTYKVLATGGGLPVKITAAVKNSQR